MPTSPMLSHCPRFEAKVEKQKFNGEYMDGCQKVTLSLVRPLGVNMHTITTHIRTYTQANGKLWWQYHPSKETIDAERNRLELGVPDLEHLHRIALMVCTRAFLPAYLFVCS